MTVALQKYPIGIESFEKIREYGMVYVDKTELIHQLVEKPAYIFLSRPRRFGKSLLLSTIAAYFEGRADLFEGLAINRYGVELKRHPVFHLNFVNAYTDGTEGLNAILDARISSWEKIYGRDTSETTHAQRFYGVIRRAVEQTGRRAVILIDEYDKFIVSSINEPELNDRFRDLLRPLYSTLKAADPYIRFAMITGVTRFSSLSIFSDLNNLKDISLNPDYGTICGITETELHDTLRPGVERLAEKFHITCEEAFNILKENYDGYHFTRNCPDLYNPFSLLTALEDRRISDYWFASGTPTFLFEMLRKRPGNLRDVLNTIADPSTLTEVSAYAKNPTALLFQTGYLTVKGYDADRDIYRLGIPNGEVRRGIMKGLLPVFSGNDNTTSTNFINSLTSEAENGNPEGFMTLLKSFLGSIPYDLSENKHEIYFENNIYIICRLLGFNIHTEFKTSFGRIDILLETSRFVYILELKLNGSARTALEQIESKEYHLPFVGGTRKVFKIGAGVSKKTRNITRWIIKSCD